MTTAAISVVTTSAAFAHWFSLLRPGGRVLIVDGDFVSQTWFRKLRRTVEAALSRFRPAKLEKGADFRTQYQSIMTQIHFRDGARAPQVARLLEAAGFAGVTIDTGLGQIHRAQAKNMKLAQALDRATQHRYAICATKPAAA